jgi:hypothetical protein
VYNQCVVGMTPSSLVHGKERVWCDRIRSVVRHVLAHEVPGTCPMTGWGCDGDFVKMGARGYMFVK